MRDNPEKISAIPVSGLRVMVVFDNNSYAEGLETAWGFSCVIMGTEKTILFDTGGNGALLIENMEKLGINPRDIDVVVLSHIHRDHVGGLGPLLERNQKAEIYFPASFPRGFSEAAISYGAKAVEIKEPMEICTGVYSTGELGTRIREQSLIIRTQRGSIIITGCAHPGILETVRAVKKMMQPEVLLAIGGFHLRTDNKAELGHIISSLKNMKVRYVGPCHCTGETAKRLFEHEYGKNFIRVGVGKGISIEDLE